MALQVGEIFASMSLETREADAALDRVSARFQGIGKTLAGLGLTAALTRPLVHAAREIYAFGSEFEAEMSRVGAVMNLEGLGMSADEAAEHMQSLRDTALDLGEKTSLSAMQAAEAMEALAMAGWDSSAIEDAIEPLVRLVEVAGTGDLQEAAGIVADSLTALGEGADQAGRLADVLTATATGSNTDLTKLGMTFKYVASMAGNLGYSMEDLALASGILANSGIKAQKAGTSLRAMLNRMSSNSKAQAAMEQLGVSMYDTEGKALSLRDVMGQLRTSMQGLSQEEKTQMAYALGGTSGMNAVLAIVNATEEAYGQLADAIDHSAGAASEASRRMLDNLKGDLTLLDSALGTTKIMLLSSVQDMARDGVQSLTGLVQAFNALGTDGQKGAMLLGAALAGLGPAVTALGALEGMAVHLLPALLGLVTPAGLLTLGLGALAVAVLDADGSIARLLDTLTARGSGWLDGLQKDLADAVPELSSRLSRLLASLTGMTRSLLPRLSDLILTGVRTVMDTLSQNMDGLSGWAQSIVTGLADSLSSQAGGLVSSGADLMVRLAEGVAQAVPELIGALGNVAASLTEALANLNWEEIGTRLMDALTGMLSSIPEKLKPALDRIGETLNGLFSVTGEAGEKTLPGTEALESMLDSWERLLTDAMDSLGSAAESGIHAFGDRLSGLVDSVDLETGLQSLAEHLSRGLQSALGTLSGIGETLLTELGHVLGSLDLSRILPAVETLAAGLAEALGEGLTHLLSGSRALMDGLLTMLSGLDLGSLVAGIGEMARQFTGTLTEALTTALTGLAPAITEALTSLNLPEAVSQLAGQAAENLRTLLTGLGTVLTEALPVLLQSASDLAGDLASALAEALADGLAGAAEIGSAILTSLGESLKNLDLTGLLSGLEQAAVTLAVGFGQALVSSIQGISAMTEGLLQCLGSLDMGKLMGSLTQMAETLLSSLASAISAAAAHAGVLAEALCSLFRDLDMKQAGDSMVQLAESLVRTLLDTLKTVLASAGSVLDAVADTLFAVDFASLGTAAGQMVTGLMQALTDQMASIDAYGLIRSLASALTEAAVGLTEAAGAFLTQILSVLTDGEAMSRFFDAGLKLVSEIGRGLLEGVGELARGLFESIASLLGKSIVKATGTEFHDRTGDIRLFEHTTFSVDPALFDRAEMTGKEIEAKISELLSLDGITSEVELNQAQALYRTMEENGQYFMMGLTSGIEKYGNQGFVDAYRGILQNLTENRDTGAAGKQAALLYAAGFQTEVGNALRAAGPEAAEGIQTAMQTALSQAQWDTDGFLDVSGLAQSLGADLGSVLGMAIPEGYRVAFDGARTELQKITEDGFETIAASTDFSGILNSEGLWEEIRTTTLQGLEGYESDLMRALSDMGISLGSLLGTEIPESIRASMASALSEGNAEGAAALLVASMGLDQVKESIREEMADAGAALSEGLDQAARDADAGTGLVESMAGAAESAVQAASSTLTAGAQQVAEASAGVSRASLEAFQTTMTGEEGAAVAQGYLDGMAQAMTETGSQLTEGALQTAEGMTAAFRDTLTEDEAGRTGRQYTDALQTAFADAEPELTGESRRTAESMAEAVSGILTEEAGSQTSKSYTDGLQGAMQAAEAGLRDTAGSLAKTVLSTVSEILTESAGSGIAEKFTSGLVRGIRSGAMKAAEAAGSVARNVVSTVRASWQVHSPSRVAMELGAYFTEGLSEGMASGMADVHRTLGRLTDMKTGRPVLTGIQTTQAQGTQTSSLLEHIAESLDKLRMLGQEALRSIPEGAESAARALSRSLEEEASLPLRRKAAASMEAMEADREETRARASVSGSAEETISAERMAAMLAQALQGCTVQMDGRSVGILVAPTVSEEILQGAHARRFSL